MKMLRRLLFILIRFVSLSLSVPSPHSFCSWYTFLRLFTQ